MRVLLDTNILIAFLLSDSALDRGVAKAIVKAVEGRYQLVVAEEVISELQERAAHKPYLAARIDQHSLDQFVRTLRAISVVLPPLSGSAPRVTRDQKDDYLLAASAIGDVDVLVSGDRDLLALRDLVTRPQIMTVADFVQMLEATEEI